LFDGPDKCKDFNAKDTKKNRTKLPRTRTSITYFEDGVRPPLCVLKFQFLTADGGSERGLTYVILLSLNVVAIS